jgi:phospholipid/cholesterol/gamma-HCH transport system substrate-binding protein
MTADERLREEETSTDERLREEETSTDERLREEETSTDERLREEETTLMSHRGILIKVSIFAVVMLLVAAGLVVVFGQFRFASSNTYNAVFENASRLKGGNDVRIAGIPVGSVKDLKLRSDNKVEVTFTVDKRYQMYNSTKAVIRYQNLVGDRFLEIAAIAEPTGELKKIPPGGTIQNTEPALDLDALLGGLRPVLKGLSGEKVNQISGAIIELLQGQGGALADLLSSTGSFSKNLADRYQVISDVIRNLNTVLNTVDQKSAQFNQSIDQLQQLVTGLAQGRDPIAGALGPLATAASDLTSVLQSSRRPIQGVIENLRPLATEMDNRKDEINRVVEPLAENYLRLNALGAYGAYFNIFYCSVRIKINGPSVGTPLTPGVTSSDSDMLIPFGGPPDPSKGRCSENG